MFHKWWGWEDLIGTLGGEEEGSEVEGGEDRVLSEFAELGGRPVRRPRQSLVDPEAQGFAAGLLCSRLLPGVHMGAGHA